MCDSMDTQKRIGQSCSNSLGFNGSRNNKYSMYDSQTMSSLEPGQTLPLANGDTITIVSKIGGGDKARFIL